MNRDEAIAIIRKEYLCVDRDCDIDKNCGKCDLMMPSKEPILEAYKMAIKALEQQPKTGHWIREKERHFLDTRTNENVEMKEATGKGYHTYINVQCSKCRKITIHDDSILYQYCPHCGAKMVEPQERSEKG